MRNKALVQLLMFLLVFSVSAQKKIVVINRSNINRKAEMVEVKVADLKLKSQSTHYVLKNENSDEIPYQWVYNGSKIAQSLIFQTDVNAKSKVIYILTEGTPALVAPKTFARFVPERKDDFAWENDLCAYRMYGPALADENPSNGVDIWLKNTDRLVVDNRYYNELQKGITYHVDHGDGLDCYKVGHTLGAGGIAPYVNNKVWVGNHFSSYSLIESGPLRCTFSLTYDSVVVGQNVYTQIITITTNAGSPLNKAVVRYEGVKQTIKLAAGIFLHDGKGVIRENGKKGIITYAENAVTDAKIPSGRSYVGVYIPSKSREIKKEGSHLLQMTNYIVGRNFTYYFGGGWSKWKYTTDDEWYHAILQFSEDQQYPLQIKVE